MIECTEPAGKRNVANLGRSACPSREPLDPPSGRGSVGRYMGESAPFTVMAKPAGRRCNLACEYCFYREKSSLFPAGAATRMSPEVLESFVRQYIGSQPRGEVTFTWQGGEPTLLGLDFFQRVVALQALCAEGRRVKNALQTNGVLLDDRWAAFLAEHAFLVGVSIDGPPQLNDRFGTTPRADPRPIAWCVRSRF